MSDIVKVRVSEMASAGEQWQRAKTEAQSAASLDSDQFREVLRRTDAIMQKSQAVIVRLAKEALEDGTLDDVLRELRNRNADAAVYIVKRFV